MKDRRVLVESPWLSNVMFGDLEVAVKCYVTHGLKRLCDSCNDFFSPFGYKKHGPSQLSEFFLEFALSKNTKSKLRRTLSETCRFF